MLADISVIKYVPFDSETIGNPALDLGDVLRFSGGHADEEQITCITFSQCRIGGKHSSLVRLHTQFWSIENSIIHNMLVTLDAILRVDFSVDRSELKK